MICDEKFPKKEHLLKTKEFRALYKKGRSFRNDIFILYCLPNGLEYNRIGFSISARNIKLSTRRNRIRRLLREAYRKSKNNLRKGFDIAIVVKKDMASSTLRLRSTSTGSAFALSERSESKGSGSMVSKVEPSIDYNNLKRFFLKSAGNAGLLI